MPGLKWPGPVTEGWKTSTRRPTTSSPYLRITTAQNLNISVETHPKLLTNVRPQRSAKNKCTCLTNPSTDGGREGRGGENGFGGGLGSGESESLRAAGHTKRLGTISAPKPQRIHNRGFHATSTIRIQTSMTYRYQTLQRHSHKMYTGNAHMRTAPRTCHARHDLLVGAVLLVVSCRSQRPAWSAQTPACRTLPGTIGALGH